MAHRRLRRLSSHYVLTPQGFLKWGILSFDSDGTLTDIFASADIDNRAGVEFYSGLLVPGDETADGFRIGERQGAVLITDVDWETMTPLPEARRQRLL